MTEILDDHNTFAIAEGVSIQKNMAVYPFRNSSVEQVSQDVQEYFTGKGYRLETGTPSRANYGKGSMVLRLLLGAFAKRFCWSVRVEQVGDVTRLTMLKEAKGYAGGIIGINQVNNEYKRITEGLTGVYQNHHH